MPSTAKITANFELRGTNLNSVKLKVLNQSTPMALADLAIDIHVNDQAEILHSHFGYSPVGFEIVTPEVSAVITLKLNKIKQHRTLSSSTKISTYVENILLAADFGTISYAGRNNLTVEEFSTIIQTQVERLLSVPN